MSAAERKSDTIGGVPVTLEVEPELRIAERADRPCQPIDGVCT
jgi:hypothetical protein